MDPTTYYRQPTVKHVAHTMAVNVVLVIHRLGVTDATWIRSGHVGLSGYCHERLRNKGRKTMTIQYTVQTRLGLALEYPHCKSRSVECKEYNTNKSWIYITGNKSQPSSPVCSVNKYIFDLGL